LTALTFMESPERTANPQTEKLILWTCFLLFCTVLGLVYSTYQDEEERLASMRLNEKAKEDTFNAIERQREQTARYIDRFTRDPEFVRDQARERLGVAEPGEVVIRLDGGAALAQPAPAPQPKSAGQR
jgi:cell division protein FtsB